MEKNLVFYELISAALMISIQHCRNGCHNLIALKPLDFSNTVIPNDRKHV